jgi:hypothetical protein
MNDQKSGNLHRMLRVAGVSGVELEDVVRQQYNTYKLHPAKHMESLWLLHATTWGSERLFTL